VSLRKGILLADGTPANPEADVMLTASLILREAMRIGWEPKPWLVRPPIVDADGVPMGNNGKGATITIRKPPRYRP
jgi:hypothetical protein